MEAQWLIVFEALSASYRSCDVYTLTAQAGDEEDLEEEVTFVVQDASRSHRHDGQTQVLNGLHAAQHIPALLHNIRSIRRGMKNTGTYNPYAVPSWCSGTTNATMGQRAQASREYDKPKRH